jgi:hypothetical protein
VLIRTENEVAVSVETKQLTPGHIFHLWYGSFDAPQNCEEPYQCTHLDFPNPRTELSFFFGNIYSMVNDDGSLVATAKPAAAGEDSARRARIGDGVHDTLNAEMHVAVRDHGPLNKDLFEAQKQYFEGNCTISGIKGADFECHSPQYVRHFKQDEQRAEATTRKLAWCEHDGDPQSGEEIPGSRSVVVANDATAMGYIDTGNLTVGDAMSLWWAVFANPDMCAAGPENCTIADLDNPDTEPQIIDTGIGDIVPDSGTLRLTATPIFADELGFDTLADKEVLLVLRDHGVATDDNYYYRKYPRDAGCVADGDCMDLQYSRHQIPQVLGL